MENYTLRIEEGKSLKSLAENFKSKALNDQKEDVAYKVCVSLSTISKGEIGRLLALVCSFVRLLLRRANFSNRRHHAETQNKIYVH